MASLVYGSSSFIVKFSQKLKLKLQLSADEMVMISFNPPTYPGKYEGDRIEQNLENKVVYLYE